MIRKALNTNQSVSIARLAALLLVMIIPVVVAAPVPREAQKPRIDYFPTQVGFKWVYKNTQNADWERTDVITSVEEKDGAKIISVGTIMENGSVEHRQTMQLSPQGLFQLNLMSKGTTPSVCFLKFPIQIGDNWECPVERTFGIATCRDVEEVEVPAGRFRAVKVVAEWKTQNIGGGKASGWFVLGIGPIKWQYGSGDGATVLHSFTTGQEK